MPGEVLTDGRTVWVNSGKDGSSVGRFSPIAVDVHNEFSRQQTDGVCAWCTHTRPGLADWYRFVLLMQEREAVDVSAMQPKWLFDDVPTTFRDKAAYLLLCTKRSGYGGEVAILRAAVIAVGTDELLPWTVKALIDTRFGQTWFAEQKEATRLAKNKRRLDRRYTRRYGKPHPKAGPCVS